MGKIIKPMKLKELLNHIDGATDIQVCAYENNEEEEYYLGCAWDCPWWVAELYLDTNEDGEAIGVFMNENKPTIVIYIKGE